MINNDKWLKSLPNNNPNQNNESMQLDHEKWINTITKKNTYNSVKKYSFMTIIFICGLLFVAVVKNQSRNLEKEINYLKASINVIEFNLKQAILDNEVITSPENISKLAKEYLGDEFIFYKNSQIKNLNTQNKIAEIDKNENKANILEDLPENVKKQVAFAIKKKKEEIEELQKLYRDPQNIPGEIKTKVAKQIEEKKFELKNLYESPEDVITLQKIGRWSMVQLVKAFLGMPIIPGR